MRYTHYVKVEHNIETGRTVITSGVTRDQLNYNCHGSLIAKYRAVTTDKVTYLYSAKQGESNVPYFQ